MDNYAIKVEGLGKRYRLGQRQRYKALRDVLTGAAYAPVRAAGRLLRGEGNDGREDSHIWALKDVSLQVQHGEVLGIIGRNGAGKSTLLKILSRITEPTEGEVRLRGRVGSLLEVGTGFHPELTGRENVYLNGAILGMHRHEIERKFDEIVAFAEVEKFLDTPVKHYSSGMYVRLAFAVAAHLEPEILLVDEVLAVGDIGFQRKCLGKMGEVARSGRTVCFVSHSMPAIESLCEQAMLLERGRIVASGASTDVIGRYLAALDRRSGSRDLTDPALQRSGSGEARFSGVSILSLSGHATSSVRMGEGIRIRLEVTPSSKVNAAELGIGLFSANGLRLCGFNSHDLQGKTFDLQAGRQFVVDCVIPRMNLSPGVYGLNLVLRGPNRVLTDFVEQAVSFEIVPADVFGTGRIPRGRSLVFLEAAWEPVQR